MIRITVLALALVAALTAPGGALADAPPSSSAFPVDADAAAARHGWLDVGVAIDQGTIEFRPSGEVPVRGVPELRDAGADGGLLVRVASGRMMVSRTGANGRAIGTAWVADDTVRVGDETSEAIFVNGKRYRGGAKVFINPRGRLTAANRVALEDYLRGVLPHEIGRLEVVTLEAGKAQAVAARTYTLSYIGRRAAEGFDLYDSVEDQVYGGTASENPLTDRAVEETEAIVALYGGAYIRANYYSTCGGATANVEDIWPDPPFPWLRQVEDGDVTNAWCKGSPHFRWVETWTGSEVLANLNEFGPGQSGQSPPSGGWRGLKDVRVGSRSPSGRVRELVYVTDKGQVSIMADKTRWVLRRPKAAGGTILRSSLFKLGLKKDSRGYVTEVVASGGGNGHGAGMCQVGALSQARAGHRFDAILRFYYSGIELVRL